ncbi:DNA polymerase beta superfamily protein [Pontibacter sp. G13]|uniref:DNA polymerase beta superfamily protein n=1 Tax=Pontibacter sp. G13 TaxID=3074898 RepID=UPI002889FF77|nr:nucleotidyltransferase domain-containing protein [Pontibacter sp. G13]WNJ18854.1 nucleotidyltransferase domain-containing protein [Pontibacter sp. G13]
MKHTKLTIERLKYEPSLVLLSCQTGSRTYGLHHAQSDHDEKGIFLLPKLQFLGTNYQEQCSDKRNDVVYYELGRFVELGLKSNPGIIEMLFTPNESIYARNPILDHLNPHWFISQKCKQTFGGYAKAQIQKAQGLNKKIVNPFPKVRKTPLEFCWIQQDANTIPLTSWLQQTGRDQAKCGLVNLPHMKHVFALFYPENDLPSPFKGIIQSEKSTSLSLSSIPKGSSAVATLFFNEDGYQTYCKNHREYWKWRKLRNEARYQVGGSESLGYDTKNMMHTFRLLLMAKEIAEHGRPEVFRQDREFLLGIRNGEYSYEELSQMAEELESETHLAFERSNLPEHPNKEKIVRALVEMRSELYQISLND